MPSRLGPPLLVTDFDGVLSVATPNLSALDRLQADAVARLDRIVRETGALLAISSAWRYDGRRKVGAKADRLEGWLREKGYTGTVSGVTPHLGCRAQEVQAYLNALPMPPRAIAILEDYEPMEHLTPWTVRTVYEDRLTEGDTARAIGLLRRRGEAARPQRRTPSQLAFRW